MNMNMNKLEEVLATSKLNELIHKKEEDEKNCKIILMILAIIGAVAAVAGIAYAVYCFLTPDYLEDFEEDFEDDFDDDFFNEEDQVYLDSSDAKGTSIEVPFCIVQSHIESQFRDVSCLHEQDP